MGPRWCVESVGSRRSCSLRAIHPSGGWSQHEHTGSHIRLLALIVVVVIGGISMVGWQVVLGPKMRKVTDRKFDPLTHRRRVLRHRRQLLPLPQQHIERSGRQDGRGQERCWLAPAVPELVT